MQVSVKKKSSKEVEGAEQREGAERAEGAEQSYIDVTPTLPELIKREVPKQEVPKRVEKPQKIEPQKVEEPKQGEPKAKTLKRPSILNLGDLLSQSAGGATTPSQGRSTKVEAAEVTSEPDVDPKSGEKLEAARGEIIKYLSEWRPRFIAVFEPMIIEGNTIKISVPTTELRDEILRGKTEFLTRVVALSNIGGCVELNIEVNESIKSIKPIKLEDRIAHIMALNPLIVELKDALDLDVEG